MKKPTVAASALSRPQLGSAAFVSPNNRDSLVPTPAAYQGPQIHRQVDSAAVAAEFSSSRGHPVWGVNLDSRTISLSVGGLAAGTCTSNHRHAYETLVYVLSGKGHSTIEGVRLDWVAGDAFYVPPWNWHQHTASPDCPVRYLAATNLPLLAQLGQTVLRQEEPSASEP